MVRYIGTSALEAGTDVSGMNVWSNMDVFEDVLFNFYKLLVSSCAREWMCLSRNVCNLSLHYIVAVCR